MLNEIYAETKENMEKSIDSLKKNYQSVRSGKVSTNVLSGVKVDYYGTPTELPQVATVLVVDATTISIAPWEKPLLGAIEKAINEANLGINPNNDGETIKLFFPPMTVEQREQSAKQAKAMTEDAKVAIRNVRKHANDKVKKLHKDKEITDDENKGALDQVQKITDEFVSKCDEVFKAKEAELLKV
jgi:ribosome recycling factor